MPRKAKTKYGYDHYVKLVGNLVGAEWGHFINYWYAELKRVRPELTDEKWYDNIEVYGPIYKRYWLEHYLPQQVSRGGQAN